MPTDKLIEENYTFSKLKSADINLTKSIMNEAESKTEINNFMIRTFLITIMIISLASIVMGQSNSTSKLYNNKGQLIADTTFKISDNQFKKWKVIEDSLTKAILIRLHYPDMFYENNYSGQIIISFSVDNKGLFNDFRLENYKSELSKNGLSTDIKCYTETALGSVLYYSGSFANEGFKADKKPEIFYLPILFDTNDERAIREVKNGWLTILKVKFKDIRQPDRIEK